MSLKNSPKRVCKGIPDSFGNYSDVAPVGVGVKALAFVWGRQRLKPSLQLVAAQSLVAPCTVTSFAQFSALGDDQ